MEYEYQDQSHRVAWNVAVAEWRRTGKRLPWTQIPPSDLVEFLREAPLDLRTVKSILDVGSCDGHRSIHACLALQELNRADVHLHCIDVCEASIDAGRAKWAALVPCAEVPGTSTGDARPQFAATFNVADATALACVVMPRSIDLFIDWMMLHALPKAAWGVYRRQIDEIRPRYLAIKCFAAGASGVASLPQTVPGVEKHQLSDGDVFEFVGPEYQLIGTPMTWSECLRQDVHVDGIEAAKRAYCFQRVGK